MKYFIFIGIIIISTLFSNKLFSEPIGTSTEDSLILLINNDKDIETDISHYLNLITFYQKNNLPKSIEYCDIAINKCKENDLKDLEIEICIEKSRSLIKLGLYSENKELFIYIEEELNKIDNNNLWGKFYFTKALEYTLLGDYTNAMEFVFKALTYFRASNDNLFIAHAYNHIGILYDYTNNNKKALENYLISKEYAVALKNKMLLTFLDNNIGIIYSRLGDEKTALKYYYKTLEYYNKQDDYIGTSIAFNNIATSLITLKRYDESMVYFRKAYNLGYKANDNSSIALSSANIGTLFIELEQLDSAIIYINKSLRLYINNKDVLGQAECYQLLGDVSHLQKQSQNALNNYNKCLKLSNENDFLALQETVLKAISNIYFNLYDYKKAFEFQQKAYIITDSLNIINKNEDLQISNFQIDFQNQSSKYKSEISEINSTYELELTKEKRIKYTFIFLLLLIVIVSSYLLRNSKKSNKLNKKLILQNSEIEKQKEFIEISNIELKEQYALIETLLNTIPNQVFYTDRNSNLLGCNKAFEDMTGISIDSMIGTKTNHIYLKTELSLNTSDIILNANNDLVSNEGVVTFNDNSNHKVILYKKGFNEPSGKLLGVLGIFIDITDIKDAQKSLENSQALLKKALNAKDKFFSIIAHDLKNPFNAIIGLTSIIKEDFDSLSKSELQQYNDLINQSSNNIYNLLENLLEWARTQSGSIKINTSTFKINDAIIESAKLSSQSINQKNIKLSIDMNDNFEVIGDRNMIMTVLRNLLSNAIKYTKNEGEIDITVQQKKKFTKVTVSDNGIGIQSKDLKRLFKIDQQVSTLGVDNEKGTGLGLIICQEFISQNGGIIEVSSQLGEGTSFSFTIPSKNKIIQ